MTAEELSWLDNYGHKELGSIDEIQLNEYATLLEMRRAEVLRRILELRTQAYHDRYNTKA